MIQEIIMYVILAIATAYVVFRIYQSVKKKSACEKCALMDAAKEAKKKIIRVVTTLQNYL